MVELKNEDLRWDSFRYAGHSGKRPNIETEARVTHIPTGITVIINASKSEHLNREKALEELTKLVLMERLLKDTICS